MQKKAFTLIELLIVIAIAVIISAALVPLFSITKQDAKMAKASSELDAIRTACIHFHQDTGQWPTTDATSGADLLDNSRSLVDWEGPYLDGWADDPWGNPYALLEVGTGSYYVASNGKDGVWNFAEDPKLLVTAHWN